MYTSLRCHSFEKKKKKCHSFFVTHLMENIYIIDRWVETSQSINSTKGTNFIFQISSQKKRKRKNQHK